MGVGCVGGVSVGVCVGVGCVGGCVCGRVLCGRWVWVDVWCCGCLVGACRFVGVGAGV